MDDYFPDHKYETNMHQLAIHSTMVDSTIDDRELLRLIGRKNEEALALLFERYSSLLYSYALRILGDPQSAEDVLQESILAVWENARRYRGEGRVKAWLFTIVHNKSLKALRKKELPSLEEIAIEPASPATGPLDRISSREQKENIRAGLGQLSPEHRRVLELVFYEEMSLKETAEICGIPVGTVKSRLSHAKTRLKGELSLRFANLEDIL